MYTDLTLQKDDDSMKIKLLLYLIREQTREICSTLKLATAFILTTLPHTIGNNCFPKQNKTVE